MRMYDYIHKKRLGHSLSKDDIEAIVQHYTKGDVPDYQMSAFAMAVLFQGMSDEETTHLTLAMASSGEMMDLSGIPGRKVDKHSTGGVGDTTTIVLAPLVASVGVPVAKMSGRGLGHTGGTIDKLESIPGFSTKMSMSHFLDQVRNIGVAVAGQTADLAPADKKLYALRDVTDTVESLPLIASSIMSKKLASGADAMVLDVKVGEGAFMKDIERARELARTMVRIGTLAKRETVAVLTQMEQPLGKAVGNALEVREAILTLRGQGPEDLTELCLQLGAEMVVLAGIDPDVKSARTRLQTAVQDGSALLKFKEFVKAQGGDPRVADDLSLLPKAPVVKSLTAFTDGVVQRIHAESVGIAAMKLGAGRATRDDTIDPSVGLVLQRKVGQSVVAGEPLVEVHAQTEEAADTAISELRSCIEIVPGEAFTPPLILDIVRNESVESCGEEKQAVAPTSGLSESAAAEADLIAHARTAMGGAYVPYSRFQVGAALLLTDGQIVTGANVENASFGLTNCAERTAVFQWVTSEAYKRGAKVAKIAVIADSDGPVAPCGACRQVLAEFCSAETPVELADLKGNVKRTTVAGLLPYAFDKTQME